MGLNFHFSTKSADMTLKRRKVIPDVLNLILTKRKVLYGNCILIQKDLEQRLYWPAANGSRGKKDYSRSAHR